MYERLKKEEAEQEAIPAIPLQQYYALSSLSQK